MTESGITPEGKGAEAVQPQELAIQGMASEVLSGAKKLMQENRLKQEVDCPNFYWTFFGADNKAGYNPSVTARDLQARSEGRTGAFAEQLEWNLQQVTDPEARKKLEEDIEKSKKRISVSLSSLDTSTEAQLAFGNQVGDVLSNKFLQDLGFLQPNQRIEESPDVRRENNGRVFKIDHPTKPFTAEAAPIGQRSSGGPRFGGFNLEYTPKEEALVGEETTEDVAFGDESRKAEREQILNVLPEAVRKRVEAMSDNLIIGLGGYMLRPGSDPEVLELTSKLLGNLNSSLNYGKTGQPMPGSRLEQTKAKLNDAVEIVAPNPS